MNEREDDTGPMLATVVGVGAGQITDRAVSQARKIARRTLRAAGCGRAMIAEALALEQWADLELQIESLILAQWALAAEDVEAAMRDEGLDPEDVALLGVPAGVVPS